jgi:glycerol-3-phosphate acyltransferase PlsX
MRIVVDAFGTDRRPIPDVEGTLLASRIIPGNLILVGNQNRISAELNKYDPLPSNIEIVDASDEITMSDKPSVVGKSKPNSSIHIGLKLVRDGKADAFVSMGNTGAVHAIAMLFSLGRIRNVKRPALSVIFKLGGQPIIFLDIGANADCKPDWLQQFAIMGDIYARKAVGIQHPRIALLSNGEEEGKGNELVRETAALLRQTNLNFIGNAEPKELFKGKADVVVCDGFAGNILIKTFEATGSYLSRLIREEIRRQPLTLLGGALVRPAMNRVRRRVDPFEVGGAPLLGVRGVVIIGHGGSNAIAVRNAILQAEKAVSGQIVTAIEERINQQQSIEHST